MRLVQVCACMSFHIGEKMSPSQFFETATAGSRIRYDKDLCMNVRIMFISRLGQYALGRQIATNRPVYFILCNNMLKECGRGCFTSVELFR